MVKVTGPPITKRVVRLGESLKILVKPGRAVILPLKNGPLEGGDTKDVTDNNGKT